MTVSIRIDSIPAGGPIADIQGSINEGSEFSLGGSTPGDYPTNAEAGDSIRIRGVNATGPGPWSLPKFVPVGEPDPGGALDIHAFATRTEVVGHGGVVFWINGPDKREIGLQGLSVEWDVGERRSIENFANLEAIVGETQYARSVQAIGGTDNFGFYRGPIAAHCWAGAPGEYVVTCAIRNRAGILQSMQSITITKLDPDVVYAGQDTICVSTSGDFTGAPDGALLVTSASGDVGRNGTGQNNGKRILLRSGETFTGGIGLREASNFYLSTFGGESPAIYTGDRLWFRTDSQGNNTVDNVLFFQDYDAAADNDWWNEETPPSAPNISFFCIDDVPNITLHKVDIRGTNIGVYIQSEGLVIFDVGVTDFLDYGIFGMRDKSCVVGSFVAQNPGARNVKMSAGGNTLPPNRAAWNTTVLGDVEAAKAEFDYFGPNGEAPNWPRHAPFRTAPCFANGIQKSHFSNSWPGWSGHAQPPLRFHYGGAASDSYACISDTRCAGGVSQITVNRDSAGDEADLILIDGCTFEADNRAWDCVNLFSGNAFLRNSVIKIPIEVTLDELRANVDFIVAAGASGVTRVESCTFAGLGDVIGKGVVFALNGNSEISNSVFINDLQNAGSIIGKPAELLEVNVSGFDSNLRPISSNTEIVGQAVEPAPVRDGSGAIRPIPASQGWKEPAEVQTDLWTLTLLPDGTLAASGATFTLNDTILEVA